MTGILIILFLSPYIIIPWIIAFLFKKGKIQPAFLTYVFTTIIIIAYTIFLQILPTLSSRNEDGYECIPPIIIIIVPLLPISLFAQSIFNIKIRRYDK